MGDFASIRGCGPGESAFDWRGLASACRVPDDVARALYVRAMQCAIDARHAEALYRRWLSAEAEAARPPGRQTRLQAGAPPGWPGLPHELAGLAPGRVTGAMLASAEPPTRTRSGFDGDRDAVTVHRRAVDAGQVEHDGVAVDLALRRTGAGQPLPDPVRRTLEAHLGVPLDRVRIHTDRVAADAAQALHAEAFTVGEDVFFAEGAYAPDSRSGLALLAHELTHVVQNWQGRGDHGGAGRRISQPGESLEREADAVAAQIARHGDIGAAAPPQNAARPGAVPGSMPAGAAASTLHRKAREPARPSPTAALADTADGSHHPHIEIVRSQTPEPPPRPAPVPTAFTSLIDHANRELRASNASLEASAARARRAPVGAAADAEASHHRAAADRHQRAEHARALHPHTQAHADRAAVHRPGSAAGAAPVAPKHGATGSIQFKPISDWSKHLPPDADPDPHHRQQLLVQVQHRILGERAAAHRTFSRLHAAQHRKAAAIRALKPSLHEQIAAAQAAALAHVAAAEATQAAAVAGAYRAAAARVNAAAAAAKAQVNEAYSATVASIDHVRSAAHHKLEHDHQQSTTAVKVAEDRQLITIKAEFDVAKEKMTADTTAEASYARSLGDTVPLPYSGDKLAAAKKAAHQVADGWAKQVPEKMAAYARSHVFNHESAMETGTRGYATLQNHKLESTFHQHRTSLDTAHAHAHRAATAARKLALAQIDAIAASLGASLAAQSAAQVAAVHGSASSARSGILQAGHAAQHRITTACDKASTEIEGGAAGLEEGARQVEAPSAAYVKQAAGEAARQLSSEGTSVTAGLRKRATRSAHQLSEQAAGASHDLAAIAASARQGAASAAAGGEQSIAGAAARGVASVRKAGTDFAGKAHHIGTEAHTKFQGTVDTTRHHYKQAADKLQHKLTAAAAAIKAGVHGCISQHEPPQILREAKKAADAVQPAWKRVLGIVLKVVVVVVVIAVATALTDGLADGPLAELVVGSWSEGLSDTTWGIIGGAWSGGMSNLLGTAGEQMIDNWESGKPLDSGLGWRVVLGAAAAGALTGGLTADLGGLADLGKVGNAVAEAMGGAKGWGNFAIRFGVNTGVNMWETFTGAVFGTGSYKFHMIDLVLAAAGSVVPSTGYIEKLHYQGKHAATEDGGSYQPKHVATDDGTYRPRHAATYRPKHATGDGSYRPRHAATHQPRHAATGDGGYPPKHAATDDEGPYPPRHAATDDEGPYQPRHAGTGDGGPYQPRHATTGAPQSDRDREKEARHDNIDSSER